MLVITTGMVVFAGVGAGIAGTVGWTIRHLRKRWVYTLMDNIEYHINEIGVYQLTKEQEHCLFYTGPVDTVDLQGVALTVTGEGSNPSPVFKFAMHSDDGRVVIWHQHMPSNELLIQHFYMGNRRERSVAVKYKDILKKVSSEAYTMWKMSQP